MKNINLLILTKCALIAGNLFAGEIHEAVKRNDYQAVVRLLATDRSLIYSVNNAGDRPIDLAVANEAQGEITSLLNDIALLNYLNDESISTKVLVVGCGQAIGCRTDHSGQFCVDPLLYCRPDYVGRYEDLLKSLSDKNLTECFDVINFERCDADEAWICDSKGCEIMASSRIILKNNGVLLFAPSSSRLTDFYWAVLEDMQLFIEFLGSINYYNDALFKKIVEQAENYKNSSQQTKTDWPNKSIISSRFVENGLGMAELAFDNVAIIHGFEIQKDKGIPFRKYKKLDNIDQDKAMVASAKLASLLEYNQYANNVMNIESTCKQFTRITSGRCEAYGSPKLIELFKAFVEKFNTFDYYKADPTIRDQWISSWASKN